jgi:hypothetical protein
MDHLRAHADALEAELSQEVSLGVSSAVQKCDVIVLSSKGLFLALYI